MEILGIDIEKVAEIKIKKIGYDPKTEILSIDYQATMIPKLISITLSFDFDKEIGND